MSYTSSKSNKTGKEPKYTLQEEELFAPRFGRGDSSFGREISGISSALKKLNYKLSARGMASSRGARGVYLKEPPNSYQRVTIKAYYSRNRGESHKKVWKEYVKYIQRDGVGKDQEKAGLFSSQKVEDSGKSFLERSEGDENQFRFILSPENSEGLNLESYTKKVVEQIEMDTGYRLDYLAAAHFNTENPHVHLTIRGKDLDGHDVFFKPDYISNGIRIRCREILTRELGLRSNQEIRAEIESGLTQNRVTPLDKVIAKNLGNNGEFKVSLRALMDGEIFRKSDFIKRLEYLENLELARLREPGDNSIKSAKPEPGDKEQISLSEAIINTHTSKVGTDEWAEKADEIIERRMGLNGVFKLDGCLKGELFCWSESDILKRLEDLECLNLAKRIGDAEWRLELGFAQIGFLSPSSLGDKIAEEAWKSSKEPNSNFVDEKIARGIDGSGKLSFNLETSKDWSIYKESALLRRLEFLESKGLASKEGVGNWKIQNNFQDILRDNYLENELVSSLKTPLAIKTFVEVFLSNQEALAAKGSMSPEEMKNLEVSRRVIKRLDPSEIYKTKMSWIEAQGLKISMAPEKWVIQKDFLGTLKENGFEGDIIKSLFKSASSQTPSVVRYDPEVHKTIQGKILDVGLEKEISDSKYLVIKTSEKEVYYLRLGRKQSEKTWSIGANVKVESFSVGKELKVSDHKIFEYHSQHGGVFDLNAHMDSYKKKHEDPEIRKQVKFAYEQRLTTYEEKGIAKNLGAGQWEILERTLEGVQKSLEPKKVFRGVRVTDLDDKNNNLLKKIEEEIVKTISSQDLSVVRYDPETHKTIQGQILEVVQKEQIPNAKYLVVKTNKKEVYLLKLDKKQSKQTWSVGANVKIETFTVGKELKVSDDKIFEYHSQHGGVFNLKAHLDSYKGKNKDPEVRKQVKFAYEQRLTTYEEKGIAKNLGAGQWEILERTLEGVQKSLEPKEAFKGFKVTDLDMEKIQTLKGLER